MMESAGPCASSCDCRLQKYSRFATYRDIASFYYGERALFRSRFFSVRVASQKPQLRLPSLRGTCCKRRAGLARRVNSKTGRGERQNKGNTTAPCEKPSRQQLVYYVHSKMEQCTAPKSNPPVSLWANHPDERQAESGPPWFNKAIKTQGSGKEKGREQSSTFSCLRGQ